MAAHQGRTAGGRQSRALTVGFASITVAIFIIGVILWRWNPRSIGTDDAFTEADVVNVGTEVSGVVRQIHFADNTHVDAGTPLLDLDEQDLILERDAAQAARDGALAQRDEVLLAIGATAESARRSHREAAEAAVRLAEAKLALAQRALDKAHLTAPVAGFVANRMVSTGDLVRAGQPLLAIVSDRGWIIANLKETQLRDIAQGQAAEVTVDAYPALKLRAHVEGLQHGTGQVFSVLPSENATGSFVKIVQRVPVRLVLDETTSVPLLPGLSAHVSIRIR